jgi:thiosulfate/3-mercaptopyruvate sulfurtransferase
MTFSTLITPETLEPHLGEENWAIIDCRGSLTDSAVGRLRYLESHIPGAIYAHLDQDLSAVPVPGQTGRHPLPAPEVFASTLARWGIDERVQVVVYDDQGGMFAGRLWWMLRWMGHDAVAVLDGQWQAWTESGMPTADGEEARVPRRFTSNVRHHWVANADEVLARLNEPGFALVDARGADRYRGENETIDPKGGHIPGAVSAPFAGNLDDAGRFQPAEQLHTRYSALFGDSPAEETVFYCGSGVSAAHDLLAVVHAGFPMPRLYVGSWSDWIVDPNRPIVTGPEPR